MRIVNENSKWEYQMRIANTNIANESCKWKLLIRAANERKEIYTKYLNMYYNELRKLRSSIAIRTYEWKYIKVNKNCN